MPHTRDRSSHLANSRGLAPTAAVPGTEADSETLAAMAWTRIAEGEDSQARAFVEAWGYEDALARVARAGAEIPQRWTRRYDPQAFAADALRPYAFLKPGDPLWPEQLDHLGSTAPLGLWVEGDPAILSRASVAIVGSRTASPYGTRVASDVAFDLASDGILVVSGGAFGIDACAHRGALAADGYTAIVSASGLDRPYPASHGELFSAAINHGGVVCSESPPGCAPHRHRFLARNRIIAALARATVVIEAPVRSGALSTARHASAIGRDVGAVPGPITSPHSSGCHRLLREGAVCVTSADDVRELIRCERHEHLDVVGEDPLALRVRDAIPVTRSTTVDRVAREAGVSVPEALTGLGILEAAGAVERHGGGWRLRRS